VRGGAIHRQDDRQQNDVGGIEPESAADEEVFKEMPAADGIEEDSCDEKSGEYEEEIDSYPTGTKDGPN
jgi:hypothetical protein